MPTTESLTGIVLKRTNYGETDRLVTLFTKERGKLTVLAKGVRKISSTRASSLEPATESKFYLRFGRGLPLLTECRLISSHSHSLKNLTRVTQVIQILEVIDHLTVEDQENPEVYVKLHDTLTALSKPGNHKEFLLEQIRLILKALGFTFDKQFTPQKLKNYIEELSSKPLRTKPFLTVK